MRGIRGALGFGSGFAFIVALALLMGPTGGLPSRPTFQTVRAIGEGGGADPNVLARNNNPNIELRENDGAADNERWAFTVSGEQFRLRTLTDSGGAVANVFTVDRTAEAIDNITFPQTVLFTKANIAYDFVSGSPRWRSIESDGPANEQVYDCIYVAGDYSCRTRTDVDGAGATWLTVTRTGTAVDLIDLSAASVTVNGAPISGTGASGTFTASFDTACTTTPTITYDWTRSGNIVVLYAVSSSGFPCTGDSTSFVTTAAPVPAAIRPNTNVDSAGYPGYTDNSAGTWANITITSGGNISFNECTSFTASCNGAGWTAALNRAAPTLNSTAYMLGNP